MIRNLPFSPYVKKILHRLETVIRAILDIRDMLKKMHWSYVTITT